MTNKENPLSAALDKMVDHILNFDEIPFLDLVQHAWRKRWVIAEVADPEDNNPLRYALKACLLERMAEIWSAPPKNMPSMAPAWCHSVPPAPHPFSVISPEFTHFWEGEAGSAVFAKRNIFAPNEFMFFL